MGITAMTEYMEVFFLWCPLFFRGMMMTFGVTAVSACIGFGIGSCWGVLCVVPFRVRILSPIIEGMAFLLRAVPFYVWLLLVYFVLPDLFGCNLEPFSASVTALGFSSAGYVTRIVATGIAAIPKSQFEAGAVLGYRSFRLLGHIILPQAVRNILPLFYNELESLLKSTSVISSIGLLEITRVGMNIVSRHMHPVPVYFAVAACYLVLSFVLVLVRKAVFSGGNHRR